MNKQAKAPVYVVFDAEDKEIARYTPTKAQLEKAAKPKMDCLEIPCPPGFDENVTCWKCKIRPPADPTG